MVPKLFEALNFDSTMIRHMGCKSRFLKLRFFFVFFFVNVPL